MVEVNSAGWHAALEGLMMPDPHPKGYIHTSPAARLSRALYAYEWACQEYPLEDLGEGRWRQSMPDLGAAREAILTHERKER